MPALYRIFLIALTVGLLAASVSADELCLTGNARRQQNLPVKFTAVPEAAGPLFDGSEVDGKSAGLQDTTIELTFAEPVIVSRVVVVVYNDPQRSFNAAGRAQVSVCKDTSVLESLPWTSLDGDAVITCGLDGNLILGSRTELLLPGKQAGERLELRLEKKADAHQMLVREVYVWGLPAHLKAAAEGPGQPLTATATDNTYSSLRATWPTTPSGAAYVRVRTRAVGDTGWRRACFAASPAVVLWLKPATTYEVAVEAVGVSGATKPRRPLRVDLPHPLALRTMGDAFGMNFYPGGGGAHQARPDEAGNTAAMLALLQDAGVRQVRWWIAGPGMAELLAERGMSLLPSATYEDPAAYQRLADTCGVWLTQTSNEPDFSNVFAEEYVREFIPRHTAAQRFSPLLSIAGPAAGGEMVGPGADYLRASYAAGLKQAVDAIDIHPYGKYATPAPPGSVIGGPEGLLSSVAATREVMRAVGDNRPLIASESGHPTYEGQWFMPPSSYERQAQWVIRTHLLLIASGVRRIIWYAFEDEGTDRANPEHCFGLVDWYGQPKPAFSAYRTMTRLLGAAQCEGLETKLRAPLYGVRCRLPDETRKPRYVTALWDSGGSGTISVKPLGVARRLSLEGKTLPVPAAVAGGLRLPVDESVQYVLSDRPLVILDAQRVAPPLLPSVQMSLSPATITVQPGQPVTWTVHLTNEFALPVQVELETPNPWQLQGARASVALGPRERRDVTLTMPTPPQPKGHQIISWDTRCHYRQGSAEATSYCRAQFFIVP